MDWNSLLPLAIPQVLAVADTIPSRLFLWRNKMNEEIMNEIQPVRPKDQFTFSCRQCGACCRNIEGCVMVESLDAYRLARYLRTKGEPIEGIEDFLFRYCEPEPLTEEGFPIYMLKTKAPNDSCIFLTDGRCSVYPARTRTCRIYPLTVGPGERGRDFEYCLCLDRHRATLPAAGYPSRTGCMLKGYEVGGADYVTKPFSVTVLCKKVAAVFANLELRTPRHDLFDDGFLKIDFSEQSASLAGESLDFTPKEYRTLFLFVKNPRIILTKRQILEKLWDIDGDFVDEHISLRYPAGAFGWRGHRVCHFPGTLELDGQSALSGCDRSSLRPDGISVHSCACPHGGEGIPDRSGPLQWL